jgi:hypothetical protein
MCGHLRSRRLAGGYNMHRRDRDRPCTTGLEDFTHRTLLERLVGVWVTHWVLQSTTMQETRLDIVK